MVLPRSLVLSLLLCGGLAGHRPGVARAQAGEALSVEQGAVPGPPAVLVVAPEEEAPRLLTVALSASAGMQYDSRACSLAGVDEASPSTSPCVIFAAGGDVALLWRRHLGGVLGVYSASGQAVRTGQAAAIPDRISVPIALEVRPLSFLGAAQRGYAGRVLSGVALRLGPSVEIVRTATDLDASVGMYLSLAGEVPLSPAVRRGVALRAGLQLLYSPVVSLSGGQVLSAPFNVCPPQNPPPGCESGSDRYHGSAVVAQTVFGLVFYP